MENSYCLTQESPVKRKVLGDINNRSNSPISPTANLKLLTKVAAAQYDSIENDRFLPFKFETATPPNSKISESEPTTLNVKQHKKGGRKLKSLGFLCNNFLNLFPLDVPEDSKSFILLSKLAEHLGVEKRRVYDIINVVESLQMATKIGKNKYCWVGRSRLADTLSQLKAYAEQTDLAAYVRKEQYNRNLYLQLHPGEIDTTGTSVFPANFRLVSFLGNERRTGVLCQKFIMIFLVSLKDGLVNLDLAADILMRDQSKTRLRRLYDIANVLVSLRIIKKMDMIGLKKPAFCYVGPPVHGKKLDEINTDSSLLRKLISEDIADSFNSDFSEDSNELVWNQGEKSENVTVAAISDHSYSRFMPADKPVAIVEPAAKKRLVFPADRNMVIRSRDSGPSEEEKKPCGAASEPAKSTLRVLGQGSKPQAIQHGAVYKAVKVGNDIQLIRIDECD